MSTPLHLTATRTAPAILIDAPASPRWALAGLSLAMLMASLDTSIANTALPALADAFDAPFRHVQWVVLSYLLGLTTVIVGVGRLGDIVGRRRLLIGGLALFTAASLACGVARMMPILLFARTAQGIGAAAMMAFAVALIGDVVPRERTGRAMGLMGTMSAAGTTLGPVLGGVLAAHVGWGAIFLINVPIGLVAMAIVMRHLPADRQADARPHVAIDVPGMLLFAAALGAYALAMTAGHDATVVQHAGIIGIALVSATLFVLVETRHRSPLIDIAAFRVGGLAASLVMTALVSAVMMTTLIVGPFYLSVSVGLSRAAAGLALSVGPLVAAISGLPAGRLVDRFGAARMTVAGLTGLAIGSLAATMMPVRFGAAGYVAAIAAMTSSYALFQTANNTTLLGGVRERDRGVTAGLLNLARNLGLITGASFMGAVFAWATSSSDISTASSDAIASGTHSTFGLAALAMLAALLITFVSHSTRRKDTND